MFLEPHDASPSDPSTGASTQGGATRQRRPGAARWRALAAALLIAGAVGSFGLVARAAPENAVRPSASSGRLEVGRAPPPLAATRISGADAVSLSSLAGRVVILDFWATWCSPCRAIMPVLDAMYRQHRDAGLSVIGLSAEPDARIRAHLDAAPVGYTVARDGGGTMRAYGVRGIPTLVVLDRAGDVREVMVGIDGSSIRRLTALVQRLLAEPAP